MTSFLVGLLGEGIQHSLTPPMHVTEAELLGVEYEYRILDLLELGEDPRSTPEIVRRARDDGFAALNVTYPCKQLVIPVLDELSPEAARLDAVNLVLFRDGRMIGHNTDWTGFRSALTAGLPGEPMETVTQIGTGGAGAATAYALLSVGVTELFLSDLDPQRAEAVADNYRSWFPGQSIAVVEGRSARHRPRPVRRCGQRDPDGDGAAPRHGRRRRRAQGRRVGRGHRLRADRDRAPPRRSLGGPSRARRRPDGGRAGGRQHPPDHGAGARRGSHAEALPGAHRDPIVAARRRSRSARFDRDRLHQRVPAREADRDRPCGLRRLRAVRERLRHQHALGRGGSRAVRRPRADPGPVPAVPRHRGHVAGDLRCAHWSGHGASSAS